MPLSSTAEFQIQGLESARGGCWPTDAQCGLLKASISANVDTVDLLDDWLKHLKSPRLDQASHRLLPLLHHQLASAAPDHPELYRFAPVQRFYWLRQRLLNEEATTLLKALAKRSIPTLILKGLAVGQVAYPSPYLRPMDDFDILVPRKDAERSLKIFEDNGWVPLCPKQTDPEEMQGHHSLNFRNDREMQADLHWHLMEDNLDESLDASIWENATPIDFEGIPTLIPCRTDLALHSITHGIRWDRVAPLRWIADVLLLFPEAASVEEEEIFLHQATKRNALIYVQAGLQYLATHMRNPFPRVLKSLDACEPDDSDILRFLQRTRSEDQSTLSEITTLLWYQLRKVASQTSSSMPSGLRSFLDDRWHTETWSEVAVTFVDKSLKRLR